MNGARADPCVNTITNPRMMRTRTIGPSHHFFCVRMNAHNSGKIASFDFRSFNHFISLLHV